MPPAISRSSNRNGFTAYVKGDVAALERIFADDLVYVHSNDVSDPKSAVLHSFASGELKISRFDLGPTHVCSPSLPTPLQLF